MSSSMLDEEAWIWMKSWVIRPHHLPQRQTGNLSTQHILVTNPDLGPSEDSLEGPNTTLLHQPFEPEPQEPPDPMPWEDSLGCPSIAHHHQSSEYKPPLPDTDTLFPPMNHGRQILWQSLTNCWKSAQLAAQQLAL